MTVIQPVPGRLTVHAASPEHYGWLCSRVGYSPTIRFKAIEALDSEGRIHGMMGFDMWTDNSAQMHVALASRMALRCLLWKAFEYLFGECGRAVALACVSGANAESLKLTAHAGFRTAHVVKDGHSDGIDLHLLEMRREQCRFFTPKEATHAQ